MKILVLQHIECETPGQLEDLLEEKGFQLDFVHGYRGDSYPEDLSSYSGLLVMGGPMGVYEEEKYPFLKEEKRFLKRAVEQEKPILGICLGSQLLASVLGAEVKKGPQKEIGWYEVSLKDEAKTDRLLKNAPATFMALHWHGDIFELPKGALSLAQTQLTQHQAFRYKENVYGFLFHMEVTEFMLPIWVDCFADELNEAQLDGQQILAQAKDFIPSLQPIAQSVFSSWLNLL